VHEVSLAAGIVRIANQHAAAAGASRVLAVRVRVGALGHTDPDALAFAFEAARSGPSAEARLDIERVSGEAFCMACGENRPVASLHAGCPICGGHQLLVTQGDDLKVVDLEVERGAAASAQ
jgi:hydrogenase nickel incorporation protein HypA/HybF